MIFDKPFNFNEMLRRTIFLGRPNFFNAKDFNKELLIIHSFIEEFNRVFAVHSNVRFNVTSFSETLNAGTNEINRQLNIQWGAGHVFYKGIKFPIAVGGLTHTQLFPVPDETISPKQVRPNTYLVLTAELGTVTYADNPVLCGIQSDEIIATAPSVDVEQYKNVQIIATGDPSSVANVICVLATIHPRHKENGDADGTGFMYHTFNNEEFFRDNGYDREPSEFQNNNTLFEYILERVVGKLDLVLNERQLVRRFNLADIENFAKARHNLGLSTLVNRRQLVQAENLRDIPNPAMARQNLGLGDASVKNVGTGSNDVAPGNILPVGGIMIWSGSIRGIPTGWVLCDGSNETPDLRGKFVVGYDFAVSEFNLIGKEGDNSTINITSDNIPEHTHTVNDPGHTHSFVRNYGQVRGGKSDGTTAPRDNGNALELYPSKTNITINPAGGSAEPKPIKTLPPYYVLCYIMYKGSTITPPTPLPSEPVLSYPNYSIPDNTTDGGLSAIVISGVGGSGGVSVGAGIILTNPE
jgi:microcystin-dependent protein